VIPKDFLQCLTLEHVKTLLRNGERVLHAALNAGLSGPGRLHDLCVALDAASPGEMKSGAPASKSNMVSPRDRSVKRSSAKLRRGISHLSFVNGQGRNGARDLLASQWRDAKLHRTDQLAKELSATIFVQPQNQSRPKLRAFVRGTPFQLRVWRALLQVPAGSLTTYGRLSAANRANRRPPALLAARWAQIRSPSIIPCHRLIRETGVLGNYRWDPIRKRAMIGWEISARSPLQRGTDFQSVGRSGFQPDPRSHRQDACLPPRGRMPVPRRPTRPSEPQGLS